MRKHSRAGGRSATRLGRRQRSPDDISDRHYRIGYGSPPKHAQFKPGQSGNLAGKPRGTKNHNTILRQILFRRLPIRDRGKVRHVPVIEAIFLKFAEEALRGNPKAATFLLNRYAPAPNDEAASHDLSGEENEILQAFAQRILGASKKEGKS
jgi:hypothetical protein